MQVQKNAMETQNANALQWVCLKVLMQVQK
jgi:hypothetical protein